MARASACRTASATPSVETEVNARKGRYTRIPLPSRFGGQHMPQIEAIDLRREPPMRGRFTTWTRVRVNLAHVPEGERPAQESLEVDYDPLVEWERPDAGSRGR